MKKQTKATLIAKVVSIFTKLNLSGLIEVVKNLDELKSFVTDLARSPKEKVAIDCLQGGAKFWNWTEEQQDKIGKKITIVPSAKDVWSGSKRKFFTNDKSTFGEATITSEEYPFSLEDLGVSYTVKTENDLFPNQIFIGMDLLTAIRKFVDLVDRLNRKSIKRFGKPKYYIPGFEAQKYFHSRPNTAPAFMQNGCWYHYVAANFRDPNDFLTVSCSYHINSSLRRNYNYVGHKFSPAFHFIVLQFFGSEI